MSQRDNDTTEVNLVGGPYDGATTEAPQDFHTILMPGEVQARWVGEDDMPDEMERLVYRRRS